MSSVRIISTLFVVYSFCVSQAYCQSDSDDDCDTETNCEDWTESDSRFQFPGPPMPFPPSPSPSPSPSPPPTFPPPTFPPATFSPTFLPLVADAFLMSKEFDDGVEQFDGSLDREDADLESYAKSAKLALGEENKNALMDREEKLEEESEENKTSERSLISLLKIPS